MMSDRSLEINVYYTLTERHQYFVVYHFKGVFIINIDSILNVTKRESFQLRILNEENNIPLLYLL